MSTLQPGSTLQNGKYEIQRVLGQGGFGVTYLALQQGLNRIVAIKEFFMENFCVRNADTHHVTIATEGSRELVERYRNKFLKEARNIAKLEHPNIVSIIDVFEENSTAYYVMKYAQNGSLDGKVKREGHLSEAEATRYILKIANALRFVHQHKMTHLDVKPANILLSDNDEPWLIDFGLSKQYDAKTGEQTSSTPLGYSPGYAPIEQYMAGGAGTFSPESDIYSLGATFYKLLTGATPPDASTVANEGLPVQELKAKGVSQKTIYAIFQAMEHLRKDRLHDMDSFISLLEEGPVQGPSEQPAIQPPSQPYTVQTIISGETAPAAGVQDKDLCSLVDAVDSEEMGKIDQEQQLVHEAKKKRIRNLLIVMTTMVVCVAIVALLYMCRGYTIDTKTFDVNGVSFTMIHVEGGTFTMGATSEMTEPHSWEKPTHQVTLSSYYIGETEVTQALWEAVMGSNPSYVKGDNRPVEYVSWHDCQTFINRLNSLTGKRFRLPTEAEWEFAARGGNKSCGYQYSGSDELSDVAWYKHNCGECTHPVKTKLPNELGIYDMTGNVWEWCSDWDGPYSAANQTNPDGPSRGTRRVNRGGGWRTAADRSRIAYRGNDLPETNEIGLGLRLALSK